MQMDAHLQHLKVLRQQMNDHEDKVALLSAEQREQDSHVRQLRKEHESVRADINQEEGVLEAISREISELSKVLTSTQNELGLLDTNSDTLSQAQELMDGENIKRSSSLLELKSFFEKVEAGARSKLDEYQAHYKLLQRETKEGAGLGQAAEKAPSVKKKSDDNPIVEVVEMVEGGHDGAALEVRLRQLQEEVHRAEEDLKRVDVDIHQLEAGFGEMEESLSTLKEEKLAEEDFMHTLRNRLQQLKNYSQEVDCGSCKHVYVIECEGSTFVTRAA